MTTNTYALIVDDLIREVSADKAAWPADLFTVVDVTNAANAVKGARLNKDGSFTPPAVAVLPVCAVSSARAKIWLYRAGKYEAAQTAALADPETAIWWTDARTWALTSPNVVKIGAALALTREDITAAFQAAAQIAE
jgi:hypothetical protein